MKGGYIMRFIIGRYFQLVSKKSEVNEKLGFFKASDISAFCGCSRQYIYDVFNEKKIPSLEIACKMLEYVNKFNECAFHLEDLIIDY